MTVPEIVESCYLKFYGMPAENMTALPQSGSDRKYFRLSASGKSVIGAYNPNHEENEAFIGFTRHFRAKGLPVPEVYGYLPDELVYFQQDLGDVNLFTWLQHKHLNGGFDSEVESFYRKVLDNLINFQIKAIDGLDLELCYPHKSFDRQSMMWDMNYFKYMFLKLLAVGFNERRLEHDFEVLADYLLMARQDFFLYRDFQSANVMIVNGEPWFIDYQGGRKGAPQYDVASLLYDAKAHIPQDSVNRLFEYHIKNFCKVSGESEKEFQGFYTGYSMIRIMQALGAFGFRGLYEKKPTFTGSIVPAVRLFNGLIDTHQLPVSLPELMSTVRLISSVPIYKRLEQGLPVE